MKTARSPLQMVNRFCAEAIGYLIVLIVLLLVLDTIGVVFRFQIPILVELAMLTVVASAYLGLSYTEEIRGHVKVEAVLNRLTANSRHRLNLLWGVVSLVVIGLTAYAAGLKAWSAYLEGDVMPSDIPLVLWPIRSVIAFSLLIYTFQILANLLSDLRRKTNA